MINMIEQYFWTSPEEPNKEVIEDALAHLVDVQKELTKRLANGGGDKLENLSRVLTNKKN